ncbi:MAG: hypothetical protein LBS01_04985 [Prevotellaceae bacterium]|jgi:hypothetical protein|nr:hypothetical protein [Prevotellaceae bacterium]
MATKRKATTTSVKLKFPSPPPKPRLTAPESELKGFLKRAQKWTKDVRAVISKENSRKKLVKKVQETKLSVDSIRRKKTGSK